MNASRSKSSTLDTIRNVPVRAALFDVGGTLVDRWLPREEIRVKLRSWAERELGSTPWIHELVDADVDGTIDVTAGEPFRQRTALKLTAWFAERGFHLDAAAIERVRLALSPPLDEFGGLAHGAKDALRWCRENGMRVILVSNTFTRGDAEIARDDRRYGIEDLIDGVVTSLSAGWLKPHPAIFHRALELAGTSPAEAFMVGDRLDTDVAGARGVGMRALLKLAGERDPRHDPAAGGAGTGEAVRPDGEFASFEELPRIVSAW